MNDLVARGGQLGHPIHRGSTMMAQMFRILTCAAAGVAIAAGAVLLYGAMLVARDERAGGPTTADAD